MHSGFALGEGGPKRIEGRGATIRADCESRTNVVGECLAWWASAVRTSTVSSDYNQPRPIAEITGDIVSVPARWASTPDSRACRRSMAFI